MAGESRATTSAIRVTPEAHGVIQRAALSAGLAVGKRVSMSEILVAMAEVVKAHPEEMDAAIRAVVGRESGAEQ